MEVYATAKWHAYLGSGNLTPVRELRLFRIVGSEVSEVQPFTVKLLPDGATTNSQPLFRGHLAHGLGGEMESFLRAIVEVAAENGIFASGTKDATRELTAVRDHLQDMRTLALKQST